MVLANCPFHDLAERHRLLVCGINRDFVTGLVAALGCAQVRAVLAPAPGRCCVVLEPATGGQP